MRHKYSDIVRETEQPRTLLVLTCSNFCTVMIWLCECLAWFDCSADAVTGNDQKVCLLLLEGSTAIGIPFYMPFFFSNCE